MNRSGGLAEVRRIGRRVEWLGRRARRSHRLAFVALALTTVVFAVSSLVWQTLVPASLLIIPLVLGGLLLRFRELVALTGITVTFGAYVVLSRGLTLPRIGFVLVLAVIGWIMLTNAKVRSRLGVPGTRGESMLMELRDILTAQGELPPLPAGWLAEVAIRSAGGSTFSGDFVVSTTRGDVLEVALVDVSGKGIDAGTRALLLSGAFGGLLGVVPEEEFLPSANRYLRRQDWDDDFATVVHVAVDLRTGNFDVRTAGHPPAIQFDAWSGRWQTRDADGPLLGLMEAPEFSVNHGQLKQGDALFLYSDGMVETPLRDIGRGTDRLAGAAERLVAQGFQGGADVLVDAAGGPGDDSAIVIIHRTALG
ncbi:stage II sporulation protein E [Kribbella steppae]|uniref:Stage II sporulation protein E n=1 Tax=Kribbella steppae TaxID=2512223 RepID=A0A4R2HWN5_9ACTN|nr:PP2C family protein-serine/threonine phosphatase [Kribbella steppae]TCO35963.1 stage II sporulation protein E [Kribbella steppae]